jgi:iron(III) transport system ATP-binding protein
VADFLELSGIRKDFGEFAALKGVSLGVGQGELVCFLGPSGCGKTTLLRIIAGLETQGAGTIIQAGRDISRLPPMERDYGIVFQSYALFPNLSVADNVAYGLVNRRVARAQLDRCQTASTRDDRKHGHARALTSSLTATRLNAPRIS